MINFAKNQQKKFVIFNVPNSPYEIRMFKLDHYS